MKRNFRIVIIVGGAKQQLISHYLGDPNTIIIVVDNRNELARWKEHFKAKGIVYFELGPNQSCYQLAENAEEIVQEQTKLIANFGTNFGKGARPKLGQLAAQRRILEPDFQEFLSQINNEAYKVSGGCLEHVEIIGLGSYAGATGAATLLTVESVIAHELAKTRLTVHSEFNLLGPTTFLGASTRAGIIGAASLAALLATVIAPKAGEHRITRTLHVSELIPLGRDQKERDRLQAIFAQAWDCPELVRERNTDRPNDAGTDCLGNVYSHESDLIGSIQKSTIAGHVAASLSEEFQTRAMALGSQPGMIDELYVEQVSESILRPDISSILGTAASLTSSQINKKLLQTGFTHHLKLKVRLSTGQTHDLSQLAVELRHVTPTFTLAVNKVNLLYTLRDLLAAEIASCQDQCLYLESLLSQSSQLMTKGIEAVTARKLPETHKRVAATLDYMDDTRNVADELAFQEHLQAVLDLANADVAELIDLHSSSMESVAGTLSAHVPSGVDLETLNLVEVAKLDDVYPELVALCQLDFDARIERLSQLATRVTVHGLAQIADCQSTSFDQIAQGLLNRVPEVQGPPLGGKQRLDPAKSVLILPCMKPHVQEEVASAIKRQSPSTRVEFTDRITFGVGAVRFLTRQFHRVKDLFGGQLIENLNQAYQDPVWALNFINLLDDLKRLGAEIVDGRIEFPDK